VSGDQSACRINDTKYVCVHGGKRLLTRFTGAVNGYLSTTRGRFTEKTWIGLPP